MVAKRLLLPFIALLLGLGSTSLFAQYFSPERTGGIYYAYPVTQSERINVPQGFEPFYISHYGRHGSRWLPDEERYLWVIRQFSDDANLTPLGKDVKRRLRKIWKNARGHAGQLTPLGARQHQCIARRMVRNYPEVFAHGAHIQARSSVVPRCRASMLAFCHELPSACTAETDSAFMAYINHESPELKALTKRTRRLPAVSPDRFVGSLFRESPYTDDDATARHLLGELHTIASDMQDVPLKLSLWDVFTTEEMLAAHDANNERMTICNGDTIANEGIAARSSIPLWQNIETEADAMIASGGHGASLRFGHDTALYRLLTLLQLQLPGTGMEDILPMAANLQLIFVRNSDDSVLVAFLHNERLASDFQPWNQLKQRMRQRIHELEHLRQLSALNTMVGTAPANTRTAGLFGKGSEEHGQTLPAVLVPHGQTFWTPQTRNTEQKCVAPYYYTDTLFQGIRASHWLVGGCTQDYGSFTVSAHGGKETPDWAGTPFSHAAEVSHPYYYAISLPSEHLLLEMTALSHSACLRITPLQDQPVHIVIETNSDEEQGTIAVDRQQQRVYATNPVHRIYQGWGEPAGFSGHFVLEYADSLVDSHRDGQRLTLTFCGQQGQPITLKAATSFTGRNGAEENLLAEAGGTFGQMERRCIEQWTERLHAIDISDPDTARVNQFYGALYRASFLPHQMSDCSGSYPAFSKGAILSADSTLPIRYGDFSMWDTYRALHPLLCIIDPQREAQMMQSLVGMYEDGGWLPIFPCWNSYTAAMIGDHSSSVLADAYVKGIRHFDAAKAYEAMRKNAFEQPDTYEEYKDGMGRRALGSYMKYGFIPLEDSVKEAFHQQEQTSRTLEYAYDDFCVAQMAKALGKESDYDSLMRRSTNWRNVINPLTGYADGRHADGSWEGNTDLVHRKPYITEGATCHYTWYVPHDIPGLINVMGGRERFIQKLDSLFTEGRYWHGNEPCHQVAWLYSLADAPEKTRQRVSHILQTEYNDTPGGLSGNDDAGQMSAWQVFASMGFYPVCPGTPQYVLGSPQFQQVVLNQPGCRPFIIRKTKESGPLLNGEPLKQWSITHEELLQGGTLLLP